MKVKFQILHPMLKEFCRARTLVKKKRVKKESRNTSKNITKMAKGSISKQTKAESCMQRNIKSMPIKEKLM